MKSFSYLIIFSFLLIFSCRVEKTNIITVKLNRSDFVEKLLVTGTVQAVTNFSVLAPRSQYGTMTVTHLAPDGSYVKKGDTICVLSSPDLLNFYETFTSSLETMEADLKKLVADNALNLSLLEAQVETNKAQMEITFLDSVQMKYAPPVKQKLLALEMEKSQVLKKKLEKKFISQKLIDESEIRQMNSRIMQQKGRIQMMTDQIAALSIVASRDGIVMHTEAPMIMMQSMSGSMGVMGGKIEEGSNVFSNMPLLQFPDLSKMQVSTEIAEADYKRIEKGQPVTVKLDASNNLITTGKINRKALVGRSRYRQQQSKVKTYEAIIDIDSCHLQMKPGLSASCEITLGLVKDTVTVPTLAVFERDSLKTVYVADGKMYIPITVETGLSNSSFTIISHGLKGDETIALSEPPHYLLRKIVNPLENIKPENKMKHDSLIKSTSR